MSGISLVRENFEELDKQGDDLLVLTIFSDERPLRGLNGLVDWRLNGRLSQMLMKNDLTCKLGDQTLMPTNSRLPAKRLLLLGLGQRRDFDNMAYANAVESLFDVVARLKVNSCSLSIPGIQPDGDDYFLERMAILIKEIRNSHVDRSEAGVSVFVGGKEAIKDIQAKFDLISSEVDKLVGTGYGKEGKA